MANPKFRKALSAPGLLQTVRSCFDKIADDKNSRDISLSDCLMSGLAVFGLKYPSLLQFDKDNNQGLIKSNLRSLYGIEHAPCDTYMRERLDDVLPEQLRKTFSTVFAQLQRGKGLEDMCYMDGHYLLSIDGTGYFSSTEIHCDQCCEKHHRDGRVTYYHQLLSAVLIHPEHSEVFPLVPEPIVKQDGVKKNDCERNAAQRLLADLKREHPHLKLIIIEDGLASNGPHIQLLKSLNHHFILGAKPKDHQLLFDWVDKTRATQVVELSDEKGTIHRFRYLNNAPLNDANFDTEVNFLEYWERRSNGKQLHFSWVTDIFIQPENLMQLMRGARARWRIENETFNTLKTQGYHFEHNFGHGYKHLSTVFACLMMLAFLIDQIQQHCCSLFQKAREKAEYKRYFWEKVRNYFQSYVIDHWEALYSSIAFGIKDTKIPYNTS